MPAQCRGHVAAGTLGAGPQDDCRFSAPERRSLGGGVGQLGFAGQERLIRGAVVAIDGSKIRAVATRKAVLKAEDVRLAKQAVAREIATYLAQLDALDQLDAGAGPQQGAVQATLHGYSNDKWDWRTN
jgi:hypothetical protein